MEIENIANRAIEEAEHIGVHAAEAYVVDASSLEIEAANEKLETIKLSKDTGIGLRVITKQGTVGFAFTTDLNPSSISSTLAKAVANSQQTFADKYNVLPPCLKDMHKMSLLDPEIQKVTVDEKIELAKRIEVSAKIKDKRVLKSERCVYEDAEYQIALASSNGTKASYRAGYCGLYGVVLAEQNGDIQTGMSLQFIKNIKALDPEKVGNEAATDAVRLLGAKSIGTTKTSIVLSPYIATSFFSILIPALCADSVQKGRSLFKGKLGQKVVSPLISLIDDGTLKDGIATRPFDGEGVKTKRTDVIVDGVLDTYLYNTYTANKDGVESTGNGMRNSFKSVPSVSTTNFYVKPGKVKADDIIKNIQDGFYITNVMGMHTANPISGDFSVGASGVWIKNGEFTQAVRGVAIAGNILELFSQVDAVGDDLKFFGAKGAPTLLIKSMTISGQ